MCVSIILTVKCFFSPSLQFVLFLILASIAVAFEDESKEDIVKSEQSSSSQIKDYIEDDLVPADDQNLQLTDGLEG